MNRRMISALLLAAGMMLFAIAETAAGQEPGRNAPAPGESEYAERAERMLASAVEAGDDLATARAQHRLARHMKTLSLFPQALIHAELARETARDIDDAHTRLAIDITYASILAQLDRTAQATEILLASLPQARALGSTEQEQWALLGLSSAYVAARQLAKAEDFARQGLELARTAGDRVQEVRFLSNLGLIAHTAGDMETANARIRDAISVKADELPPDVHGALILASITLAGTAGQDNAARARELIAEARRDGSRYIEGFATEQLGQILCGQGTFDQGLEAFADAQRLFLESERLGDLRRLNERWAECLAGAGRFETALEKQREAMMFLDQVHERRQQETLQAHDIAFRTEQHMTELARLAGEEQALQARVARQRALSGWLAAGALLLLGVLAGFWIRNRRLREQHDAQQALQQARIDLLARTSHEIRNPTQGIIGILEGRSGERPLQEKHLDTALSAARMVGHLANEYLDLALLEQGKFRLDSDALCYVPGLVDRLETLSAAFIKAPGQFLVTRVDDRVPDWIRGDGERLAQVLLNLISNAAHYARDGEITLTVTADHEAETLHFSVADRGPGFDPSDAANFDPYARGSRRGGNPRGSGLGLAISARVVNAMGGTIVVRNRRAGGADLALTFPLRPAPPAAGPDRDGTARRDRPGGKTRDPAPDSATAPGTRPLPSSPAGPLRVLIIDDDPFARLGLRSLVESAGGQVGELDSDEELEPTLKRFDPEAVLIDYRLGSATGIDIAERIRRHDTARAVPRLVAIISGSESMEMEKVTGHLIDRWLLKPVGKNSMAELLRGLR